jgi:hypothetical protein
LGYSRVLYLAFIKKGTREMNNEPVAWMAKNRDSGIGYVQTDEPIRMDKVANEYLPLYLHPAKALTDEEIYEILWKYFPISDKEANANFIAVMTHCVKLALRKAQE